MIRSTQKALIRNMLILSETDVRRCFPVSVAIATNRKALCALRQNDDGGAMVPTRIGLPYHPPKTDGIPSTSSSSPADWTLFKPAAYYPPAQSQSGSGKQQSNADGGKDEVLMGMKLVSIRANNPKIGKPTVPATIMLVNAETGESSALVAATYLTAARTAAGSALATQLALSKHPQIDEGLTLVVFGAGLQAELHIKSIRHVVNLNRVIIVNRSIERAEHLKENLLQSKEIIEPKSKTKTPISDISTILLSNTEEVCGAVRSADVIATTTNTSTPLFDGKWLKPGCHINGVGSYTPLMQEVDEASVMRCEVIIDTKEALDVGDLACLRPKDGGNVGLGKFPTNCSGLIGDILSTNGTIGSMRDDPNNKLDCTFFKSVGTAIQDVISAQHAFEFAVSNGIGTDVEM